MKPRHTTRLSFPLAAALAALLAAPSAHAASPYTWTQNSAATQTWTTTGNWNSSNADLGPGTTTRTVMERLGLPKTLLGVDAVLDGALAGADAAPPANASAAGPEALVVAAVAFDLGSLPSDGAPSACRATLLVDEVAGILNFDSFLPALWRAGYPPGDASVVPAATST